MFSGEKMRAINNKNCFFYCLFFGFVFFSQHGLAESLRQDEVIASYLYNFAKHITWPDQQSLKQINIGVYNPQDAQLTRKLRNHFSGARVNQLPFNVKEIQRISNDIDVQLLFVGENKSSEIEHIYQQINSRPIVLVTLNQPNKQLVMINLVNTPDYRILFEVNKANLLSHGLKVSSDIILNGGTEIDVAALFKEGQASLIKLQQQLREREKRFNQLQSGIEKLFTENKDLNKKLTELRRSIAKSSHQISAQQALIDQQQQTLNLNNQERARLEEEVSRQTQQLESRQFLLNDISQQIAIREKTLEQLNETLLRQKSKINELDNTIATKDLILNNLIIVALLGSILIIVTIWAYISKKKDAEKLEERRKALQIAGEKLAYAKARAEEANQAKSEFLSLMSHELRTPLQAIIGYADVVIEDLRIEGLDNYTNDLERVINNSERLLRLINSVLDLAKIESGRMDLNLEPVNLESLAMDAIANIRPQCEEKKIAVSAHAWNGDQLPIADREKLLHIILNLLSNACKFTDNGSIKLFVEHKNDQIFISVSDTGTGISKEQLPYVFDRFKQADSSTTRSHQGSGLGLAISKQFCELMGGTIEVNSDLNRGTTFTIQIPLPIENNHKTINEVLTLATKNNSNRKPVDHHNPKKLLIIDNDSEYTGTMISVLRKAKYVVYTLSRTVTKGLTWQKKLSRTS